MTNNLTHIPGFPDDKANLTSGKTRMHDSESLRLCVGVNTDEDLRMSWNANDSVVVIVVTNLLMMHLARNQKSL